MSIPTLFTDVEYVTCDCEHRAVDHHGVDNDPRSGGCFGSGSGFAWSLRPKCSCRLTCSEVSP